MFAEERYVHFRGPEARALFKLGARERLMPALTRFAGTPEPMAEAIAIARDVRQLSPDRGGWVAPAPGVHPESVAVKLRVDKPGPSRLLVLGAQGTGATSGVLGGTVDGVAIPATTANDADVFVVELGEVDAREVQVSLSASAGIGAVWLVPRADESRRRRRAHGTPGRRPTRSRPEDRAALARVWRASDPWGARAGMPGAEARNTGACGPACHRKPGLDCSGR